MPKGGWYSVRGKKLGNSRNGPTSPFWGDNFDCWFSILDEDSSEDCVCDGGGGGGGGDDDDASASLIVLETGSSSGMRLNAQAENGLITMAPGI